MKYFLVGLLLLVGCVSEEAHQRRAAEHDKSVIVTCFSENGIRTVTDTLRPDGSYLSIEQDDNGVEVSRRLRVQAAYTGNCVAKKVTLERSY